MKNQLKSISKHKGISQNLRNFTSQIGIFRIILFSSKVITISLLKHTICHLSQILGFSLIWMDKTHVARYHLDCGMRNQSSLNKNTFYSEKKPTKYASVEKVTPFEMVCMTLVVVELKSLIQQCSQSDPVFWISSLY